MTVITSDDGLAELTIPAGGLPDDISRYDIELTMKEPGEYVAVYDMTPNGLTFLKPARLEIQLSGVPETAPLLFLDSDNGVELMGDTQVKIDFQNNTTTIAGDIQHFSEVITTLGWFKVSLTDNGDYAVDDSWTQTGKVENLRDEQILNPDPDDEVAYVWVYPWTVIGNLTTFDGDSDPVAPIQVLDFPASVTTSKETVEASTQLTCEEPGIFVLNSRTTISGSYDRIDKNGKKHFPYVVAVEIENGAGLCAGAYIPGDENSNTSDGVNESVNTNTNSNVNASENVNTQDEVIVGVLALKGGLYPEQQFHIADPDACGAEHYHSSGKVYTIDLTNPMTDLNPSISKKDENLGQPP